MRYPGCMLLERRGAGLLDLVQLRRPAHLEAPLVLALSMCLRPTGMQAEKALSGVTAGVVACLATFPLETMRTCRSLSGATGGIPELCRAILAQKGWRTFYRVSRACQAGLRLGRTTIAWLLGAACQGLLAAPGALPHIFVAEGLAHLIPGAQPALRLAEWSWTAGLPAPQAHRQGVMRWALTDPKDCRTCCSMLWSMADTPRPVGAKILVLCRASGHTSCGSRVSPAMCVLVQGSTARSGQPASQPASHHTRARAHAHARTHARTHAARQHGMAYVVTISSCAGSWRGAAGGGHHLWPGLLGI